MEANGVKGKDFALKSRAAAIDGRNMKFLLVALNAKYIHSNPAIYSLRAYAGEALQEYTELAEYTINQSVEEILGDIYKRKPDAVGFSCYIWNWRMIQELLGELPKVLPEAEFWLGGPEVSYDADAVIQKFPCLSGIMVGEGEAAFRELLTYYVRRERSAEQSSLCGAEEGNRAGRKLPGGNSAVDGAGNLRGIGGLCLPSGYTSRRGLLDMDSIPFLYDELRPFQNKIIYYESSRGCPFRCSYCLSSVEGIPSAKCPSYQEGGSAAEGNFFGEKRVRTRDICVVKQELQFFLDKKVKQVKFVDRTFNCEHAHAMAVWQYLYEHDNGVTNFHFEISADILQEEEIELLGKLRPGLVQLEVGVQSTNADTLKAVDRRTDLDRLEWAVGEIRKGKNIHQHLDLIAGLPFEDYESFGRSFDRVYRMRPQQLQLGFLKVLKGSKMWQNAREYGICHMEQPPYEVLYTKWLSYGEMLRLKRIEEMVELYYNSGQFVHTLLFLERAFPGPFAMYEALADFYEEKGYFTASPARIYRYQVLLNFASERDRERQPVYRELLVYDMYLRENVKSRPDFAVDLSLYKERIRDFYREEERERRYLPEYRDYDWKQMSKMSHVEPFFYPVWDHRRMTEGYPVWGQPEAGPRELTPAESAQTDCGYGESGLKEPEGGCCAGMSAAARWFVLFNYKKRSPLNFEAEINVLSWQHSPFGETGCHAAGKTM